MQSLHLWRITCAPIRSFWVTGRTKTLLSFLRYASSPPSYPSCNANYPPFVCFSPFVFSRLVLWVSGETTSIPSSDCGRYESRLHLVYLLLTFIKQELWRKWIEPAPFRNFSDPVPSFAGTLSSFLLLSFKKTI